MGNKALRTYFLPLVLILGAEIASGCSPSTPATPNPTSALPSQDVAGLVEKLTLDDLVARANSVLLGEVVDITYQKEANVNI